MSQPPNPIDLSGGGPIPGRVIRSVQRYLMPGGRVRERREIEMTVQAPDGSIQTTRTIDVVPPLECGCVLPDLYDVAICGSPTCMRMVCRSHHTFVCPACRMRYCTECCRVSGKVQGVLVDVCRQCAPQLTTPRIIRTVRSWIWGPSS